MVRKPRNKNLKIERKERDILRLVGVYNANGGFLGELAYIHGKMTNKSHCALCDITHGNNPFGKKEWKQARTCLAIPVEFVHLNEMDVRTEAVIATTVAPAIVALLDNGSDRVLINAEELHQCNKDSQQLVNLINERVQNL